MPHLDALRVSATSIGLAAALLSTQITAELVASGMALAASVDGMPYIVASEAGRAELKRLDAFGGVAVSVDPGAAQAAQAAAAAQVAQDAAAAAQAAQDAATAQAAQDAAAAQAAKDAQDAAAAAQAAQAAQDAAAAAQAAQDAATAAQAPQAPQGKK